MWALKEIEKTLAKWSHFGSGLSEWTRDEDAHLERERDEYERVVAEETGEAEEEIAGGAEVDPSE